MEVTEEKVVDSIDRPRLRVTSSELVTNMRVTAVSFLSDFLLSGEGNILICNFTNKRIGQTKVFNNSIIHGICPLKSNNENDTYKLAIFGGKSFAIITTVIKLDMFEIKDSKTYLLEDWIWDVKWLDEKGNLLGIALAHNSVLLWDCQQEHACQKAKSTELSLLYSACLIGTTWDNLVVASGTVYQEIILWSPVSLVANDSGQVLHRLTGHQGVIFSIKFNLIEKILCSTSDDRTVRVWKFTQVLGDKLTLHTWKTGSFSLIHTLYGHESRVWLSEILPKRSLLASIGEDSNICLWNYKDGSLIETKNLSCGGLWSLSVNEDESLIAMGGGDGSLSLHDLSKKPFLLEESITSLPSFCPDKDFFRDIALIESCDNTRVIATTNNGLVLSYNIISSKWTELHCDELIKNYSVLSISPKKGLENQYVAIGTLSGCVILLREQSSSPFILKAHNGKVHSLFWVKNVRDDIMMTCGPEGCVCLWKVTFKELIFFVEQLHEVTVPMCKQRFPSAVFTLNDNSICILGDRMGGIHVYNTKHKLPIQSLPSFHGKNGVTDICEIDDLIYTTGRDGQVATFRLSKTKELDLLYSFKVPGSKLEWIGRIVDNKSSMFLLAGFHTMKFVLWSRRKQSNLLELQCGGGHRSWDFSYKSRDFPFIFVCLRKNQLTTWTSKDDVEGDTLVTLKPGFHPSKIWSGVLLFVNESSYYVATGGEDNMILISQFSLKNSKKCLSLSGHISIVRTLDFIPLPGKLKGLLLSAGGQSQFLIWEIWLHPTSGNVGHTRLCNYFLRNEENVTADHRMRFMHAVIKKSTAEDCYDIYLACSDSKIRTVQFNIASRKLQYVSCISVGNSCVFRLNFLKQLPLLVSGDGNGILKFWKDTNSSEAKEEFSMKVHEAGINSMTNLYLKDNLWLICSGGDDNKIVVNLLTITLKDYHIISTYEAIAAHAAQITGVHLKMQDSNKGLLYSVSIDQRLNIWEWNIDQSSKDTAQIKLEMISSTFSHVADVAGCIVCENENNGANNVLVFGSGIEFFQEQYLTL